MILLTGATGFLGSEILFELLRQKHPTRVITLIRGESLAEAKMKLADVLAQQYSKKEVEALLNDKVQVILADLSQDNLGLSISDHAALVENTTSVIHCAASVNRRSESACFKVNIKGTIELITLIQQIEQQRRLQKITFISSTTVNPPIIGRMYKESDPLDWDVKDTDPYSRSKKVGELLFQRMLTHSRILIIRPSLIIGSSQPKPVAQRYSLAMLKLISRLPILPVSPKTKIDTVPVDYVSESIVQLHSAKSNRHLIYHLSSGKDSITVLEIVKQLKRKKRVLSFPQFFNFYRTILKIGTWLPLGQKWHKRCHLALVFFPFFQSGNTYDNQHAVDELEQKPLPLSKYLREQIKAEEAQSNHG